MTIETKSVIDAWNDMARRTGLGKIRLMNATRSTHLARRLEEVGVAGMLEAVSKVEVSDFCRGKNKHAWQAGFDFLLQPSSLVKLLEGKYDNREPPRQTFRNGALEILYREFGEGAADIAQQLTIESAAD